MEARKRWEKQGLSKKECDRFSKAGSAQVLMWKNGKCVVHNETNQRLVKAMVTRRHEAPYPMWDIRGRCMDETCNPWLRTGGEPDKCAPSISSWTCTRVRSVECMKHFCRCLNCLGVVECPCYRSHGRKLTVIEAKQRIGEQLEGVSSLLDSCSL